MHKIIVTLSPISSVVALLLGALFLRPAAAEPTVYKCIDNNGRVFFTDVQKKGCKSLDWMKSKPMTIDRAQASIEERLNDPDSARYKSLVQVHRTGAVCGRVNSKNRMGGYDGFKSFVVREVGGRPEVRIEGGTGFDQAYEDLCSETPPVGSGDGARPEGK